MQTPSSSEYIPAAKRYVDLVPAGNFFELLESNRAEVAHFFSSIPLEKHEYRYQPAKWTIKEMLLHIADVERIFTYRALTIARGDIHAVFPNMDEELFAANTNPRDRSLSDIIKEFETVRDASSFLYKNLTEKQLRTEGKLFGLPVTPLGFGYMILGHPLHHINIVKERYL